LVGAYVVGLAFAFGWTPCVGPVLAAILFVAGAEGSVLEGSTLLTAYALGIGLPFLGAALAARPFMAFMARFRRYLGVVEKTMGGLLVLTGVLFLTGTMSEIAYWILEAFPALGRIG
jgi:cytochrome c-type biogenesis protein